MTTHVFRWSIVSCIGITLCMGSGCTRSIELKPSSTNLPSVETHAMNSDERVPLVMDSFQLSRNGAPQNPSIEVERRVLNRVQETHLFSTLIPFGAKSDSLGEKIISARITVDETIEPHSWLSAFKGIILGGSMFLFSPFIDFEYDYAATVGLELERWDGQVKRYEGSSSGTVQYKLFGATPIMIEELKGHVTESCLADVMGQLVRDSTLYMASSAPFPNTGIHTVTVRAKRPTNAQPTRSIIPGTIPPRP